MKRIFLVLLLFGCSTAPTHFNREPWAREPLRQADAECLTYINSAQGWGSSYYTCMEGKGWREVR